METDDFNDGTASVSNTSRFSPQVIAFALFGTISKFSQVTGKKSH